MLKAISLVFVLVLVGCQHETTTIPPYLPDDWMPTENLVEYCETNYLVLLTVPGSLCSKGDTND
jgi:hypothetical protein